MAIEVELRNSSDEAFCEGLLLAMRRAMVGQETLTIEEGHIRCRTCNQPLVISLTESDFLDEHGNRHAVISKIFPCPSCGTMNARYFCWEVEKPDIAVDEMAEFAQVTFEQTNPLRALPLADCPKCGGKVQGLGREAVCCLDCEWDNLEVLGGHKHRT